MHFRERVIRLAKVGLLGFLLVTSLFIIWNEPFRAEEECPQPPSTAELIQQLNGPGPRELIPEIREAIGRALTLRFLTERDGECNVIWTDEELRTIAEDLNNDVDLRIAAGRALAQRLKEAELSLEELLDIAINGETAQVRAAANGALVNALVKAIKEERMDLGDVISMASTAETEELKIIAARAVFELLKCILLKEEKQQIVEDIVNSKVTEIEGVTIDGSIVYFRRAASDYLAALYIYFGRERFDNPIEELTKIATDNSLTPEFRAAASKALAYYLERSDLTEEELEDLAFKGETKELRAAAARALGERLADSYKAGKITITELYQLAVKGATLELGAAAIPGLTLFLSGNLSTGSELEERFNLSICWRITVVEGVRHCLEEFYYRNSWYCNIGRYNYGTYLCVELDGPWGADFDLYVWRETGRSCDIFGCTIYLRGPDCSSTGFTADESCCFCVWTSGTRWIEVRFIHGSGSFTVRWRWTPRGCL